MGDPRDLLVERVASWTNSEAAVEAAQVDHHRWVVRGDPVQAQAEAAQAPGVQALALEDLLQWVDLVAPDLARVEAVRVQEDLARVRVGPALALVDHRDHLAEKVASWISLGEAAEVVLVDLRLWEDLAVQVQVQEGLVLARAVLVLAQAVLVLAPVGLLWTNLGV